MATKLSNLLQSVDYISIYGKTDVLISGVQNDSRKIRKGDLFVAIKGLTFDGHSFIDQVVKAGAKAIVCEDLSQKLNSSVVYVKVPDTKIALARLAASWWGNPADKLKIIGVTGTDGKTTTASIIYWLLKKAGLKAGLISTVGAYIGEKEYDTGLHVTNPEPLELHKFLALMVKKGCKYAVLEVTSHGLDQERVAGITFDVGVLTNITHEHLDYHKTFDNYIKAKSELFRNSKISILNSQNANFPELKRRLKGKTNIEIYSDQTLTSGIKRAVDDRFPESYNRMNATAAICTVQHLGLDDNQITKYIQTFSGVTGRMEEIKNNKGIRIIVDFAHTPNALEQVLTNLRKVTIGRLICVFGCASERDDAKRPMMGEISSRLADFSVYTAEDPRKEKVEDIIEQMVRGTEGYRDKSLGFRIKIEEIEPGHYDDTYHRSGNENHYYLRIPERGEAIWFAVNKIAKKGDCVVICGKGHEKSMCYNGVEYPWSDQEAVKMALRGEIMEIKHG